MTPSARIQAVIDLLDLAAKSAVPLDALVSDYTRNRRYIGSKDRREISNRLYRMVRADFRLGWWLDVVDARPGTRLRMIFWLMLGEGQTLAEVEALFDGGKYGPAPWQEEERRAARRLPEVSEGSLESADMPLAVQVECPPLYRAALEAWFGEAFAAEMRALLEPGTLDLRVNVALSDRETVRASLEKEDVLTDETPYSPWGLRVRSKAQLSQTQAFANGWVEVQDEGSQLIILACDVTPGMTVLDFCAGAGGKTLGLAAAMQGRGRLVAADTDPRRLEKARPRLAKAGLQNLVELRGIGDEAGRRWLERQCGVFDVTLVDAPCTGTGTWRRNPDQRWRPSGPSLRELVKIQSGVLDRAAATVKPGGHLVYATCSLLPAENEEQITAFLDRHPEFQLRPLAGRFDPLTCDGMLRLSPARHHTDGFFCAVLERP